jgi:hypothetical protein
MSPGTEAVFLEAEFYDWDVWLARLDTMNMPPKSGDEITGEQRLSVAGFATSPKFDHHGRYAPLFGRRIRMDWTRQKKPRSRNTPNRKGNFVGQLMPIRCEAYAKILHSIEASYRNIDEPNALTERDRNPTRKQWDCL